MKVRVEAATLPHKSSASLACGAPTVRLGSVSLELPLLAATFADYENARKASVRLEAEILNYAHLDYKRPITKKVTQDNVSKRIGETQEAHEPRVTIVHMVHDGSLNAVSLLAFYRLQKRLGLPVITTTEKNPRQSVDEFIRGMRAFEAFETDQARAPTVSVLCDPENFEAKLRYIARRHKIVNVQWAGYGDNAATWETLSRALRDGRLWCNVIGIERRYETIMGKAGKKIHPASVVPPLLLGAHSCSVMPRSYPRGAGGSDAKKGARPRVMDFDPDTWCYEPSRLAADVARARSFNAIQRALGLVRPSILDGSFYSRACAERLGLRACLGQALARSGTSREPGQEAILDQ